MVEGPGPLVAGSPGLTLSRGTRALAMASPPAVPAAWAAAVHAAGRRVPGPPCPQVPGAAAPFLLQPMRRPAGRLRHRFHHGVVDDQAFLDDHAYLLWGLLELFDATTEPRWLEAAVQVARRMQEGFAHPGGGWAGPSGRRGVRTRADLSCR